MNSTDFKKKLKKSPSPYEGFRIGLAAILAFFIGLMSIIAGSKVLLAIDSKNYNVLNWLVSYNVLFGFLSIATAYFIWSKNELLKLASIFIPVSHILILFYLIIFSENAASESIYAMVFRVSVWAVISLLITRLNTEKK